MSDLDRFSPEHAEEVPCPACRGRRTTLDAPCDTCDDAGFITVDQFQAEKLRREYAD